MRKTISVILLLLALGAGRAAPGEAEAPAFAKKPRVARKGGKHVVTFTARKPCDAAVAVVGEDGRIVRHLAAGVLGPKAPAPFKKNSLAQSLEWDGRDDDGRPVRAAGCSARVSLGLAPEFDRILAWNPYRLGGVRALAVDPKGRVYVFHVVHGLHPSDGTGQCAVFSREGEYLKTILPYPANLPEEELKGYKRVEVASGERVPFIYQAETRSLAPGAGEMPSHRAIATQDGRVVFVGIHELGRYAQPGKAHVTTIRADGSAPEKLLGTLLSARTGSGASLALSPDEKTFYATGLVERKKPTNVVYRFAWGDEKPTIFLGGKSGSDAKHFNAPRSVAVDGKGNVYVADRGNDRVAVFDPAGKFLGALKVEKPERVEVHRRTGAVYVLGGAHKEMLFKFAGRKSAKPVASLRLSYFNKRDFSPVMALDSSADPAVLWVGCHHGVRWARYSLLRIEDKGKLFGEPLEITKKRPGILSAGPLLDLELDRRGERLYLGGKGLAVCLDGRTGKRLEFKGTTLRSSGVTAGIGKDGHIYHYWDYPSASLSRFDLAGRAVPFAATGANRLPGLGSPRLRGRGVAADRRGNIYILQQTGAEAKSPGDARDSNALYLYGPDGTPKRRKLIDSEMRSLNSVQTDNRGNVYVAVGLRPGKDLLPPGLAGKLPATRKLAGSVKGVNFYPLLYGSIVKFGPAGGVIRKGAGGTGCNYGFGNQTEVKGAEWIFPGASPVPSWRTRGTPDMCLCESPRFDVDDYGRSFFPDAGRFRVGVLDTAGNLIAWLGSYGNQDSAGPKSAVPVPEIPLQWPQAVAAGDEAVYIGDRLNQRVVRVKLEYAAEETVKLPGGGR